MLRIWYTYLRIKEKQITKDLYMARQAQDGKLKFYSTFERLDKNELKLIKNVRELTKQMLNEIEPTGSGKKNKED